MGFVDFSGVGGAYTKEVVVPRGISDGEPAFSATPAAFGQSDTALAAAAGWKVFTAGTLPANDAITQATFVRFPLTDGTTQDMAALQSCTWTGRRWGFLWGNRCNVTASHNKQSNPIFPSITSGGGKNCRVDYSTIDKANAATTVRMMHWLGYTPTEYNAVATTAGFTVATDIIAYATLAAAPDTYFVDSPLDSSNSTFAVMVDKIWLSPSRLADAGLGSYEGVNLDYEVQDSRSTSQTTVFITDFMGKVHTKGKKGILYGNPLTGSSAPFNGIDDTNANALLGLSDYMTISWAPAASGYANMTADLDAQWARLAAGGTVDPSKIILLFFMSTSTSESTLREAEQARQWMIRKGMNKVNLFADGATNGGPRSRYHNQKIDALALGA